MKQSWRQASMQVLNSSVARPWKLEQNTSGQASRQALRASRLWKLEQNNMTKKGPFFGPQNVRKSRRAKMGLPSTSSVWCLFINPRHPPLHNLLLTPTLVCSLPAKCMKIHHHLCWVTGVLTNHEYLMLTGNTYDMGQCSTGARSKIQELRRSLVQILDLGFARTPLPIPIKIL